MYMYIRLQFSAHAAVEALLDFTDFLSHLWLLLYRALFFVVPSVLAIVAVLYIYFMCILFFVLVCMFTLYLLCHATYCAIDMIFHDMYIGSGISEAVRSGGHPGGVRWSHPSSGPSVPL